MREGMRIHIVHSVKGGSGKTAYSLFKAIELAKQQEGSNPKVLYFDADFKGTAIKPLIYGKDEEEFNSIQNGFFYVGSDEPVKECRDYLVGRFLFKKKFIVHTLNDYLDQKTYNLLDILVEGGFQGYDDVESHEEISENGLVAALDFVFSSSFSNRKTMFSSDMDGNEIEQLGLGVYYKRIVSLFGEIYECGYTDVVLDMMPGEDSYSKELLRAINKLKEDDKKDISVYFYAITTNDLTHIDAEFDAMVYRLRTRGKWMPYEKYIMVFNNQREKEFDSNIDLYCKKLKELLIKRGADNLDKVFYTSCQYHELYYKFCRDMQAKTFDYELGDMMKSLVEVE